MYGRLFPFVEYDSLEDAAAKLQAVLTNVPKFHVSLKAFRHFEHAKNCVVWLEPTPDVCLLLQHEKRAINLTNKYNKNNKKKHLKNNKKRVIIITK